MALNTSSVSKSLDRKLKIAGFEIPDILLIFLLLALLNFIFGGHPYKFFIAWIPTAILAIAIRIGKRGKPDNYILHLIKHKLNPRYFSAFDSPKETPIIKRKK